MRTTLALCLLPLTLSQDYALYGPCSQQQRYTNPGGCFDYMRSAMGDPNIFWYGSAFRNLCAGNSNPRNLSCFNILPEGAEAFSYQTLGSRTFNDANFDSNASLSELSCPMSVVYNSPQEYAYGCNTTQGGGQFVFDSHPNLAPLPSFFFRYAPAISIPLCTLSRLCTLVFVDAFYAVVHNIFPNWPRDNPLLDGYISPGANRLEPDPYVWVAFAQAAPVNLTFSGPGELYGADLPSFKTNYNLTGPIAMSWLLAIQDPYTNRYLLNYGASRESQLATCPLLLENQLLREGGGLERDLGRAVELNTLEMWLSLHFPSPLFSNRAYVNGGAGLWADPIANGLIPAEFTATKPGLFPVYRLANPTLDDFTGKMWSVLVVQNNACLSCHSNASVIVHYMEINIQLTDTAALQPGSLGNEGTIVFDYAGCDKIPLGSGGGQFYMLVYEQAGVEGLGPPNDYVADNCAAPGTGLRCNFPIARWVAENDLRLVGLSRWRVEPPRASQAIKVPVRVLPKSRLRLQQNVGEERRRFLQSLSPIRW